jgi:phenylpropionate dioxygenase-like ring-hydroxylating dioxygenase large terminal subunit
MYINFWYPICTTEELTAEAPVRAQLLGLRFVAFRDSDGHAHVLSDTWSMAQFHVLITAGNLAAMANAS